MNNNTIKKILYMIIAVLLGALAVKFIIWLLPVILLLLISHYIYKVIKRNRPNKKTTKKVNKTIKIIGSNHITNLTARIPRVMAIKIYKISLIVSLFIYFHHSKP